jgi:hypothetical protein
MTYWHPSKYPVRPGDKVRHDRHGFGIVIESDARARIAVVRFQKHGIETRKVDAGSLSFISKPTAESLVTVEMTRKATIERERYVAEAREAQRLRDEQAA